MSWFAIKNGQSKNLLRAGCDLLFPPTCLICNREIKLSGEVNVSSSDLQNGTKSLSERSIRSGATIPPDIEELLGQVCVCTECYRELMGVHQSFCQRCGGNVSSPPELVVVNCRLCHDAKFRFASVTTLGRYQDLLRNAVLRIKYPNEHGLSQCARGIALRVAVAPVDGQAV